MQIFRLVFLPFFLSLILLSETASPGTIQGKVNCGKYCSSIIIYVKDVQGEYSGEGELAVLDQKAKIFIPHVMPILKGTTVRLKNSDPLLHNIHGYLNKKTVFNVALPIQGQTLDRRFRRTGTHIILCDIHTEMSAYIVVLDNPFFTQPDENGLYEILDVPPGKYTLVKYDPEEKETVEKEVSVTAESTTLNF